MSQIYKRIEEMCGEKGISITQMCKDLGIPRSKLSDYKAARIKTLDAETISKIANYYDVSMDYVLCKTNIKEKPTTQKGSGSGAAYEELMYLFDQLPEEGKERFLVIARTIVDGLNSSNPKE